MEMPSLQKQVEVQIMGTRVGEWAKLIAITGSAQVAVQAIGFISGILVIRLLPVHEYALYTLANTMLGTMSILADGGIATGVMAQGGKVWQDKLKLGAVLATGMALRKRSALFSLLAVPILFYLLRKHEASWLMSTLIALSLIPTFFSTLSGKLLEIPPKLHQDIRPLQRYQVEANLGRLALLGLTMFVFPFAAMAILCAGVSQLWNNWRLRKASADYVDRFQTGDTETRKILLESVKRIFPTTLYATFSGQIAVFLLSIFGTTESVAQIGALSRLAAILSMCNLLFAILVIPRFARLQSSPKVLFARYLGIQLLVILSGCVIFGLVWLFSNSILRILGEEYSGLTYELRLITLSSCAGLLATTTHSLGTARGWIISPLVVISLGLTFQILTIWLLQPSSTSAVLSFSLIQQLFRATVSFTFFVQAVKRLSKHE